MGWPGCLGGPDKWFSSWEKGQGAGNVLLRNGEQKLDGQSDLEDPRVAWEKKKSSSSRTVKYTDSTAKELGWHNNPFVKAGGSFTHHSAQWQN